MKQKVLILGASSEMIPLITLASEEGYRVLATDRNPQSPGLNHADIPIVMDALNREEVVRVALENQVSGILTRSEVLLPSLAYACDICQLPGPSETVAALSVDKLLFRQCMKSSGLPGPLFTAPSDLDEVKKGLEIIGLPAIVKPVDFGASSGVQRVNTLQDALEAFEVARKISRTGRVLLESLMHGTEVSVETWTQGGMTHIAAITSKMVSDNGHFVETGHQIPALLSKGEQQQVIQHVNEMAIAMGLDDALAHTEILLTPEGPRLIETAARPGGDLIGLKLVELATGINMNRIMLYLALGKEIIPTVPENHAVAIRYVTTLNKEFCRAHHPQILQDPYCIEYFIEREDDPGVLKSSSDRLGYYLFRAPDMNALRESLKVFHGMVAPPELNGGRGW